VRRKVKQYNRILGVFWLCYLSPEHLTQLEVAASLGVSDSLVSDYRRRIEQELRALTFVEGEEAKQFELALRDKVKAVMAEMDGKGRSLKSRRARRYCKRRIPNSQQMLCCARRAAASVFCYHGL
jgi:predicted transcriptional regulator